MSYFTANIGDAKPYYQIVYTISHILGMSARFACPCQRYFGRVRSLRLSLPTLFWACPLASLAVGVFQGSLCSVPSAPAYPSTSSGTTAALHPPHAGFVWSVAWSNSSEKVGQNYSFAPIFASQTKKIRQRYAQKPRN